MLLEEEAEVFFLLTYTWKRGMHFRQKEEEKKKKEAKAHKLEQSNLWQRLLCHLDPSASRFWNLSPSSIHIGVTGFERKKYNAPSPCIPLPIITVANCSYPRATVPEITSLPEEPRGLPKRSTATSRTRAKSHKISLTSPSLRIHRAALLTFG